MAYEREEWHPITGLGKLVASGEESGIPGVAVKCVDIRRNTCGADGSLDRH